MAGVDAAIATFERNIEAKTGRAVSAWVELVRSQGLEKHGQMVAWLKAQHGFSHGHANHGPSERWRRRRAATDPAAHVRQAASGRWPWRQWPWGADVEIAPKKATSVPGQAVRLRIWA